MFLYPGIWLNTDKYLQCIFKQVIWVFVLLFHWFVGWLVMVLGIQHCYLRFIWAIYLWYFGSRNLKLFVMMLPSWKFEFAMSGSLLRVAWIFVFWISELSTISVCYQLIWLNYHLNYILSLTKYQNKFTHILLIADRTFCTFFGASKHKNIPIKSQRLLMNFDWIFWFKNSRRFKQFS